MALIMQLRESLHLSKETAQALAGGLIAGLRHRLVRDGEQDAADRFAAAFPELASWEDEAAQALGTHGETRPLLDELAHGGRRGDSPAGMGGLASAMTDVLSRAGLAKDELDISFVTGLMSRMGLDPSSASSAAQVLSDHLQAQLPEEVMRLLIRRAPFLAIGHVSGAAGRLWDD